MNNKDSFEQRMKMFVEKHKGLMKIVDVNIINRVSKIKQLTGLK